MSARGFAPKRGVLSRLVSQVAAQTQKNPSQASAIKRNHMVNAGPIKAAAESDQTLNETGEGLRKLVGRLGGSRGRVAAAKGGKIVKKAEGGKVGSAMSALQALAKKYQAALDMGDTALAARIKRQIKLESTESEKTEEAVGNAKAATFAKGGKVEAARGTLKALHRRLRGLEGKMAYGELDKKTGRVKGETPEQAKAKDEWQRLTDEIEKKFGVGLIDDQ